jgi:hypothetical protein
MSLLRWSRPVLYTSRMELKECQLLSKKKLRRLAGTVVVAQVQDVLHLLGLHQLTQPRVRVDVEVVHCKMYANFIVSMTF